MQRARGYRHTFLHGTEVARDGEDTGARPGRLLRGSQPGPGGRPLSRERLAPDELRALVDAAHGHGLMIFLDVVYNHFGPDGNYLSLYAPQMS